ncbi:hypothetical protein BLNAU_16581 [Blattamonas nauphoetae]|uniref:HAT C-terminal dimerisation domain-containing protein n=1 Tax=Blattamonas nauphoetae TaxID=2049346 RepID=A0ABQ9XB62_9EUKA|nr:hypothetical protein BLNAU_16581 [Blattamonas nauphoetae]
MVDTGQDSSGTKLFYVMIRFLKNNTVRTLFAGIEELSKGGTGEAQEEAFEEILGGFGLPLSLCCSIAFRTVITDPELKDIPIWRDKVMSDIFLPRLNALTSLLQVAPYSIQPPVHPHSLRNTDCFLLKVLEIIGEDQYSQFPAPNILAALARTITITTVPIESGFSVVRLNKPVQRNRLSPKQLSSEKRVKMNGTEFRNPSEFFGWTREWILHHSIIFTPVPEKKIPKVHDIEQSTLYQTFQRQEFGFPFVLEFSPHLTTFDSPAFVQSQY